MHDSDEQEEKVDSGEQGPLSSELQSFEASLAQLRPSAGQLDRDRLMFLAGQASAGANSEQRAITPVWFWPASSAVMSGVAATLLFVLVSRTEISTNGRDVHPAADDRDRIALVEQSDAMPTVGAWSTVRQLRFADDLSAMGGLAQVGSSLPDSLPDADSDDMLSARSFDAVLRDMDEPAARAKRLSTPRSASPGTKS